MKLKSFPLKWWGGKTYLAKRIIELMPQHTHYVEPYFGGGAVLLTRDPLQYSEGVSEVVNDVNFELMNFWRVLQGVDSFAKFKRVVDAIPFSQREWDESESLMHPIRQLDVEAAVAFFVRCRMSRAGEFKEFATLSRRRTRRGQNEQASAWWSCVDGLSAVHSRLRRVVVLNDDAIRVIESQDGEGTLFYLDPPYVPESRATTENYKHEMTVEDHEVMLNTVKACEGKVIISGYPSKLYADELRDWNCREIQIDNKASGSSAKRVMTEALWSNF